MQSVNKSISVFLPTREGSLRLKNKNTRSFAGILGGLLHIKLEQLLKLNQVAEIVLSTNDKASKKIAKKFNSNPKLKIVERPEHLALNTTNLIDLVKYIPKVCTSNHILWTHVTSPLVNTHDYAKAIEIYFENLNNNYDSLMSVKEIQNFIWSKTMNGVANKQDHDNTKWPRTQDLKKVYELNSAIFLTSKKIYVSEEDRIGKNPFLLKHSQLQSIDVDIEEDFKLAEVVYENYKNLKPSS